MHIPFPEQLEEDVWWEKLQQLKWLAEVGLLGVKTKEGN